MRYKDEKWSKKALLMSEAGEKYNWYPSVIECADDKIGIMYTKEIKEPLSIMFSSADKSAIDGYFDNTQK